jgi:hypothetical protein
MGVEENLRLMQTLDNAWNGKDWETFMKRHSENVGVLARPARANKGTSRAS